MTRERSTTVVQFQQCSPEVLVYNSSPLLSTFGVHIVEDAINNNKLIGL